MWGQREFIIHEKENMVNEAELVRRFNAAKHLGRDDTWREYCHRLTMLLIEQELKIEALEKEISDLKIDQSKALFDTPVPAIRLEGVMNVIEGKKTDRVEDSNIMQKIIRKWPKKK